ncbi:MAG: isocitrate lyase/phosphoenolpyruvate mutase family protein [Polyangiaceae bacterium]|nr:isocitrate lyase/phosphoenolpyruvate mutase family protein [Polyangiaceae bacterium]
MSTNIETFRKLHQGPRTFMLPNAWDAASARLFESLGAPAIATSSGATNWSLGYPDANVVPRDGLLSIVRGIARVIRVPLSVDIEAGYAEDPNAVAELVIALASLGAVGINIEDGASPPEALAAKIAHIKRALARTGADVFVNARVDVYLRALVAEPDRVPETCARAARYREAGADGIFVPKVVNAAEIREIAASVKLPLNVLAWHGLPPASDLGALGVRRLSAGSAIAQAVWGRAATVARAFLAEGRSEPLFESVLPYAEMNALFSKP